MSSSKRALTAIFAFLTVSPAAVRAQQCPHPVTTGDVSEVGNEGGSLPPIGNVCPSQSGADCPHSCKQATPGACPASTEVTYFTDDHPAKGDPRATCDANEKNCKVKLQGDLFVPSGPSKKFPTIIYNHGSVGGGTHEPRKPCAIARYFVSQGYVVFMPHRRGYAPSTGGYQVAPLSDETKDVVDAFNYLKTSQSAVVDIKKVALVGHSLGGIVSIYTNQTDIGQSLVVSIAGGSESWCSNTKIPTKIQVDMKAAVLAAKTPIYFFEPKDDVSTEPTIELSHDMGQAGHRYQAAIFGPVSNDRCLTPIHCGSEAHVCFVEDGYQVSRWAPSVLEYLQRYGVK